MRKPTFVLCAFVTCCAASILSQTKSGSSDTKANVPSQQQQSTVGEQKSTATFVAQENKDAVKIALKASRDQTSAGSNFGITATIENVSKMPIYLSPSSMALTVPPELDADGPRDIYGFIPGLQPPKGQDYWSTVAVLEPGSVVSIFWTSGNAGTNGPTSSATNACRYVGIDCAAFLRAASFSPGRYTLNVVAGYWDTYEGAEQKAVERHTQTAEIQEAVSAPQSVILFGAAIGGIIAFFLLHAPIPASDAFVARLKAWVPGVFSAVLLSMIVTILLARLSQSQFLISVTVNDVWGAIAVGFLITAAGPGILQKFTSLVGTSGSSSGSSSAPQPSPPAPSLVPAPSPAPASGAPNQQPSQPNSAVPAGSVAPAPSFPSGVPAQAQAQPKSVVAVPTVAPIVPPQNGGNGDHAGNDLQPPTPATSKEHSADTTIAGIRPKPDKIDSLNGHEVEEEKPRT